jgi:hypothetical protein
MKSWAEVWFATSTMPSRDGRLRLPADDRAFGKSGNRVLAVGPARNVVCQAVQPFSRRAALQCGRAKFRPLQKVKPSTSAGATSPAKPQGRDPAPQPKSAWRIPGRRCGTTKAASRLTVRKLNKSRALATPVRRYSSPRAVEVDWVNGDILGAKPTSCVTTSRYLVSRPPGIHSVGTVRDGPRGESRLWFLLRDMLRA